MTSNPPSTPIQSRPSPKCPDLLPKKRRKCSSFKLHDRCSKQPSTQNSVYRKLCFTNPL